jgi:hypothetical protein
MGILGEAESITEFEQVFDLALARPGLLGWIEVSRLRRWLLFNPHVNGWSRTDRLTL